LRQEGVRSITRWRSHFYKKTIENRPWPDHQINATGQKSSGDLDNLKGGCHTWKEFIVARLPFRQRDLTQQATLGTIERLELAINITAYAMTRHELPQMLPILKRLEAYRDELLANGDPLAYAKRVLDSGSGRKRKSVAAWATVISPLGHQLLPFL
jgi:hypothetical protein